MRTERTELQAHPSRTGSEPKHIRVIQDSFQPASATAARKRSIFASFSSDSSRQRAWVSSFLLQGFFQDVLHISVHDCCQHLMRQAGPEASNLLQPLEKPGAINRTTAYGILNAFQTGKRRGRENSWSGTTLGLTQQDQTRVCAPLGACACALCGGQLQQAVYIAMHSAKSTRIHAEM